MAPREAPEGARKRFAELAEEMARGDSVISAHRKGFGTRSIFVGRKMFAVFDKTGELVVKLPPGRAKALIGATVGRGWHPGGGAPLSDYVAISFKHEGQWTDLAREARAYMGERA
jgi:hypothetical protein